MAPLRLEQPLQPLNLSAAPLSGRRQVQAAIGNAALQPLQLSAAIINAGGELRSVPGGQLGEFYVINPLDIGIRLP
jgi:hypothetical protein